VVIVKNAEIHSTRYLEPRAKTGAAWEIVQRPGATKLRPAAPTSAAEHASQSGIGASYHEIDPFPDAMLRTVDLQSGLRFLIMVIDIDMASPSASHPSRLMLLRSELAAYR